MSKTSNFKVEHVRVQLRAVMLKIYPEMIDGFPDIPVENQQDIQIQKKYCSELLSKIISDSDSPYWMHAIIHDSDYHKPEIKKPSKKAKEEEKQEYISKQIRYFWNPELEKIHIHIEVITKSSNPTDIDVIFNYLAKFGLKIRKESDTIGLMSGWLQKLNIKNKAHIAMMVYHTHETDQAIADGKHKYDRSEVYTNIPDFMLKQWYDIYYQTLSKRAKSTEYEVVCMAEEYGEKVMLYKKGFDKFWNEDVPFSMRLNGALQRNALTRYQMGVEKMLAEGSNIKIPRCCIYIHGIKDSGKSETTKRVLHDLGLNPYTVETDDNGQLDRLLPENQAIFYDDTIPRENLLNIADRKPCHVYRRNSGAPVWIGCYLIIANNMDFEEYLYSHFSKQSWFKSDRAYEAMLSRFYVCEVNKNCHNQLYCAGVAGGTERGGADDIQIQRKLFKDFYVRYNQEILNYHPEEKQQIESFSDFLDSDVPNPKKQKNSVPAPGPVPASSADAKHWTDDFIQLPF